MSFSNTVVSRTFRAMVLNFFQVLEPLIVGRNTNIPNSTIFCFFRKPNKELLEPGVELQDLEKENLDKGNLDFNLGNRGA